MKSETERMLSITSDLLADIAEADGFVTVRDARTVRNRTASEGVSFLTKVLPALGKAMDIALSRPNGRMDYAGFHTRDGYPEFLGDHFRLLFDPAGRSLPDAAPSVVRHVRQILYQWYKYELPYTQAQEAALEARFLATEAALPDQIADCPVIRGARDLIARVVSEFSYEAISPRHGPGSVATREKPHEKWRFRRMYRSIERNFPFSEWYVPCASYLNYSPTEEIPGGPFGSIESHEAGTARAVFVPKDSRGPRLISCEPLEYQWIQQGIAAELVRCINASRWTSGRVNFTHQEVNRRYAHIGSMGSGWVTLDMADASDRVSTLLVERLFGSTHVLEYLLCSRTPCTVLPSGQLVRMKKFAPMGSALCFPVESLVFFALAANVLVHHCGYTLSRACERLKVYGDDIICHLEDYEAVMQYFPYVGLAFNEKKCCTGGSFRESCGLDAFNGVDVTPVKFRTRLSHLRSGEAVVSWVEYSNMLDQRGYFRVARGIEHLIQEACPRIAATIPVIEHGHSPVSFLAYRRHDAPGHSLKRKHGFRWNDEFQRSEFRGTCVRGFSYKRELSGWERLFANIARSVPRRAVPIRNIPLALTKLAEFPSRDLEVTTFPVRRRVTLIRRWCDFGHSA